MKKIFVGVIAGLILLGLTNSPARAHIFKMYPAVWSVLLFSYIVIAIRADFVPDTTLTTKGFGSIAGTAEEPEIFIDKVGFAVTWDPDILQWLYPNVFDPAWDQGRTVIHVDNEAGLANIFLHSNDGATGEFSIVNLHFYTRSLGTTDIIMDTTSGDCESEFYDCGVFSRGVELETEYYNSTGTVTPIPGAVWLFGSGLLGLLGVRAWRKPH
jgi:hypothetical protein